MIKINQIRMASEASPKDLYKKAAKLLKTKEDALSKLTIVKKSIDARRKNQILYIYSILVSANDEERLVKKANSKDVMIYKPKKYRQPKIMAENADIKRPVIVGFGPAGMFAALSLASAGAKPIVVERGSDVDARTEKVEHFWKTGELDTECNVQFGEGGAGTFSDGKLNTLVHDDFGRNYFVLEKFVQFGADNAILTDAKPHIGSDVLKTVVKNLRKELIELGGEVRFDTKLTGFEFGDDGRLSAVVINGGEKIETDRCLLCLGHSARDTFEMLEKSGIYMQPKAFAVGVRVEHPQEMINRSQYGEEYDENLPASPYKVTAKASDGRGVYSFCMCPGGYVVNASSEEGLLATNGMSEHKRDAANANSAIIVTISPEDYGAASPLDGVQFQRELEKKAFAAAGGKLPYQRFEDFENSRISTGFGKVKPSCRGEYDFGNLREVLPEFISKDIVEGMHCFAERLKGFDDPDALLSGVESRTSSPVRINRDESTGLSNVDGIYPVGEGAGYAGGIMSAAMDGLKAVEKIVRSINHNG
ncbi:MAG: FAD-dependent oxidoreductase [Lachnospiraceae bacterium]|nr:FAD-dependent oxidoreductase [Lachnospiraceae bacterium]